MSQSIKKLVEVIIADIDTVAELTKNFVNDANNNSDAEITINLPERESLIYKNGIEFVNNFNIFTQQMKYNRDYIEDIDLFNKRSLISDATKFSVIKNKTLLLDLYNKYIKKISTIKNKIVDILAETLSVEEINKNIKKYPEAIDLFSKVSIKCDNPINKSIIDYNIKSSIFDCKQINIDKTIAKKCSSMNYNYIKTINLKNKMTSYDNINDLIKNSLKIDTNIFISKILNNKENIDKLNSICDIYKKNYNKNLSIVIFNQQQNEIQYTVTNLLDNNISIDSLSGINDKYINKTNTITTDNIEEYIVLSGEINIINYVDMYNCSIENFNRDVLIIKLNGLQAQLINMKDCMSLFTKNVNEVKYKYNDIINNSILKNINSKASKFGKNIDTDLIVFKDINIYDIKNNIMKSIKIQKNKPKEENIDNLLNKIFDEIYDYINKKNKISMTDEVNISFYSSTYSIVNKLRKDIVDNYEKIANGDIDIIGGLILKIKKNIMKIDENVVEKYYLMK